MVNFQRNFISFKKIKCLYFFWDSDEYDGYGHVFTLVAAAETVEKAREYLLSECDYLDVDFINKTPKIFDLNDPLTVFVMLVTLTCRRK